VDPSPLPYNQPCRPGYLSTFNGVYHECVAGIGAKIIVSLVFTVTWVLATEMRSGSTPRPGASISSRFHVGRYIADGTNRFITRVNEFPPAST